MSPAFGAVGFATVGFGLFLIARGLFPAPTPLAVLAHELHRPRTTTVTTTGSASRWARWADQLAGRTTTARQRDLAAVERTVARHALDKLAYTVLFPIVPVVMWAGWSSAGINVTPVILVAGAGVAGWFGWVWPDLKLRSDAGKARREWSHVLATYLDVVVIMLAGGAGPEEALNVAAEAGDGAEFAALHHALTTARLRRQTPWTALGDLGTERDIRPLRELAAAMTLAGAEGSKVRASLVAKADALRARQLAEAEAAEQKASETMSVAPAAMVAVFILLICYPAVVTFLAT